MTRRYVRRKDVEALGRSLSEIDRAIVQTIAQLRLVSGAQLRRLFFAEPGTTEAARARRDRYRLHRLVERDLLMRVERRVGGPGAGSSSYVYRLGPLGHRLTEAAGTSNRRWTPGVGFVQHTLAIAETYVVLSELQRAGDVALLRFDTEPATWIEFAGSGGQVERVKPDGYIVLRLPGYEAHWFLEVDRGTEGGPALRAKCERYLRYFQTGREQERLGLFPQIRFVVTTAGTPSLQTDAERVEQIEAVIARLPKPAQRLFAVHALDELADRVRAGPTE